MQQRRGSGFCTASVSPATTARWRGRQPERREQRRSAPRALLVTMPQAMPRASSVASVSSMPETARCARRCVRGTARDSARAARRGGVMARAAVAGRESSASVPCEAAGRRLGVVEAGRPSSMRMRFSASRPDPARCRAACRPRSNRMAVKRGFRRRGGLKGPERSVVTGISPAAARSARGSSRRARGRACSGATAGCSARR